MKKLIFTLLMSSVLFTFANAYSNANKPSDNFSGITVDPAAFSSNVGFTINYVICNPLGGCSSQKKALVKQDGIIIPSKPNFIISIMKMCTPINQCQTWSTYQCKIIAKENAKNALIYFGLNENNQITCKVYE